MTITFKGTNHLYYGIIILLVAAPAALVVDHWPWRLVWLAVAAFGLWVAVDDLYQHWRMQHEPRYESPIHRWYVRYLWPIPVVQKFNRWLDELFS